MFCKPILLSFPKIPLPKIIALPCPKPQTDAQNLSDSIARSWYLEKVKNEVGSSGEQPLEFATWCFVLRFKSSGSYLEIQIFKLKSSGSKLEV
jgi:hypothetical protein